MHLKVKHPLRMTVCSLMLGTFITTGGLAVYRNTQKVNISTNDTMTFEYEVPELVPERRTATLDTYLSKNPVDIEAVIAQRDVDTQVEEVIKTTDFENVAVATALLDADIKAEEAEQARIAELQRQQRVTYTSKTREYKVYDAEKFYIPVIHLEYAAETFDFDYEHQAYLYSLCQEFDLDYFLMMGVIARESRFTFVTSNKSYCGYMGVGKSCETFVREDTGNYNLSRWNEFDNLYIGCYYQKYCIEQTGSVDGGLMAYGLGLGGYNKAVAQGITSNSYNVKAWKFRKLLIDCERIAEVPEK